MILVTDTTQYLAGNVQQSSQPLSTSGPSDLRQWAARQVEKVYAAYAGGRMRLAPYLDTLTEETDEIRAAYPVMLKDGPIRAALMTKVLAVSQLPLQVHPRQKKAPRDRECGEFVRHALSKIESAQNWIGVPGIAWTVLGPACVQGFSVANKVWADQPESVGQWKGKRIIRALKGKDVAGLRLEVDPFRNVTGIKATKYNAGEVFDPRDFVVYSHLSWYENPSGSSDFRAAYGNWWRKNFIMQLWDLHLDKFTGGMLKGTYTDVDQKDALREALEDARSNTWMIAPLGTLVESMQLATGGETTEFEKRCRYLDEQSLIAIVGAFLHILTGQVADARGDTGVAKETSELFQWMLALTLGGVIEKQLAVSLVEENYADVEPPGITLGSISEGAMLQRAQLDLLLQQLGYKLSADEGYGYFGRNEPADESDVLVPPVAAPAPGLGFSEPDGGATDFDDDPPPRPRPTPPPGPAPIGEQQPLAGVDGEKAESLLRQARTDAVAKLSEVSASAVRRLFKSGPAALRAKSLYSNDELTALADTLASITATGELLGRARIRRRMGQARAFSEDATDFSCFDEGVPLLAPNEALDYFTGLVPTLGVDKRKFGPLQERRAFTLAAATDQVVLEKVQAVIRDSLQRGEDVKTTAKAIDEVLDAAGVGPRQKGYAEMVARTNLRGSYVAGAQRELAQVADYFPVWRYVGIRDGRERDSHRVHFGKYFPSSIPFTEVRDSVKGEFDGHNDRCDFVPIPVDEWEELQANGARLARAA